ncbi:M56 family metallopeptidase [uncultured Formosa sp.]|uniref:M56 family metallopeptidase n=1 Tax=uncultured Formosa sp. TaxID=255435 RepID=UPI00260FF397|nr:M56 family metallopeptidase [uncultured Formosa sp.]
MDYFLKASAILAIFYGVYMFWLQKETFFNGNRWFLLSGLIASALLPFVIIPIYIDQTEVAYQFTTVTPLDSETTSSPVTWLNLATLLYGLGVLFFLVKFIIELISLKTFISKLKITKKQDYNMALTNDAIPPFSFFKYIVYNPSQFTEIELTHIINHEKIHASQYHSIDILVSKIITVFFWCNPIIWFYKKALIQNLEFLADQEAMQHAPNSKTYQNLLLKTTIHTHQFALTTNFYNSLIKKRILMLNTSKSNTIHTLKYAIIAPALVLFMMSFNTKTVYNTIHIKPTLQDTNENELVTIISKDNTDEYLESLVESFKSKDVVLQIKNVKRNATNEITNISIDAKSENSEITYKKESDHPISAIKITLNIDNKTLRIGAEKPNSDIVFTASKNAAKVDANNKDAFIIHTSDGSNITLKRLNDDLTDNNVMYISEDGKRTHVTTNSTQTTVKETQETAEATAIDELEQTAVNTPIKNDSISTAKTSITNETSEVILITKSEKQTEPTKPTQDKDTATNKEYPLILVNGKEMTKTEMKTLDPDTIEQINVLKGETAIKKYSEKGKEGVIEIILKKN